VAVNPDLDRAVRDEAARARDYRARERAVALTYGIACHALFAAAIASTIFSIGNGLGHALFAAAIASTIFSIGNGLGHALFAAAIASTIFSIGNGLGWGIGPFEGAAARAANLLLVVQFPPLHPWLLSRRDRSGSPFPPTVCIATRGSQVTWRSS